MQLIGSVRLWHRLLTKKIERKASCNLTGMNMQYTGTVSSLPMDQREQSWVGRELSRLQFENRELKRVAQRLFAPHCKSGLCNLKLHLLGHIVESLGSFEAFYVQTQLSLSVLNY